MAEQKYGVKETQEVLEGSIDYGNLVASMLEDDGKISKGDLTKLLAAVPGLAVSTYKAVEGIDKMPAELGELSDEEAAQLVAASVAKFGWKDEKAKKVVYHALQIAAHTGLMVKAILVKEEPASV